MSNVRPESEFIARGLGKLEPAPAGKNKDGLYDTRLVGQNQRFARLKVAAVEHDQGSAVGRLARHVGAIDTTLQPGAVKGNKVGTEPFKTPAKPSFKKAHMTCGYSKANSTQSIM